MRVCNRVCALDSVCRSRVCACVRRCVYVCVPEGTWCDSIYVCCYWKVRGSRDGVVDVIVSMISESIMSQHHETCTAHRHHGRAHNIMRDATKHIDIMVEHTAHQHHGGAHNIMRDAQHIDIMVEHITSQDTCLSTAHRHHGGAHSIMRDAQHI